MMREYEYTFSQNLHNKIKEKVIGKNYVFVRNDELYIKIETYGGLIFETTYPDFAHRILNGFNSDYIAYEVLKKYKKFIINRHFRSEEGVA